LVPDFTFSSTGSLASISAGQSATATLNALSQNGYHGTINLSCTGLTAGENCTFSPATLNPQASGSAVSSTIAISTTAPTSAHLRGLADPLEGIALGQSPLPHPLPPAHLATEPPPPAHLHTHPATCHRTYPSVRLRRLLTFKPSEKWNPKRDPDHHRHRSRFSWRPISLPLSSTHRPVNFKIVGNIQTLASR
jgi:hypothetical protein